MEAGVGAGWLQKGDELGFRLGKLAQISLKSESFQRSQVEETCPGKGSPSVWLQCSKAAGAASLAREAHGGEPWERERRKQNLPDLPTAGC